MSTTAQPLLLSPSSLQDLLTDHRPQLSILDATWVMPGSPRVPREEFLAKRIPGAQFLDLDEVADQHELGLKHMMPQGRMFAATCGACF